MELANAPPVNGSFRLSSNIVRDPSKLDDDLKAQLELEFDRWRTAIEVVQRMREAGVSCELSNNLQKQPVTDFT